MLMLCVTVAEKYQDTKRIVVTDAYHIGTQTVYIAANYVEVP